jgi:hypothetical protein
MGTKHYESCRRTQRPRGVDPVVPYGCHFPRGPVHVTGPCEIRVRGTMGLEQTTGGSEQREPSKGAIAIALTSASFSMSMVARDTTRSTTILKTVAIDAADARMDHYFHNSEAHAGSCDANPNLRAHYTGCKHTCTLKQRFQRELQEDTPVPITLKTQ